MVEVIVYKLHERHKKIRSNVYYVADIKNIHGISMDNVQVKEKDIPSLVLKIINILTSNSSFIFNKSKIVFKKPGIISIENFEKLEGFSVIKKGFSFEEQEEFENIFIEKKIN